MLAKTEPPGDSTHIVSDSAESVLNIKLPRIELHKFSGHALEWQSFREQFEAFVGEAGIPAVCKFGYQHSSLESEGKRVLQDLKLTTVNYPIACTILRERFRKADRILFVHTQAILNTSIPAKATSSKYIASLWKL